MEDAEVGQLMSDLNHRLTSAEAQTQQLAHVLNQTQIELQTTKAAASASVTHSFEGLPKGVKTRAPDRFSGRPTVTYPTTKHFVDFATRYMRVGGVPVDAQVDYVALHLLEGEARTWYDLRPKSIPAENFESFSAALYTHFANTNSQRHYREALQSLHMKQFPDVMSYNQAFRQMLLCLEDMAETDKFSHCERGLEAKFRIAVRQARCMDVTSAMAEVDIVADAHQTNVIVPHLNIPTPVHSTMPHMGVEPMQISALRNNHNYGHKKQPRMQNGPRQGRYNNNGPPSSRSAKNLQKVNCLVVGSVDITPADVPDCMGVCTYQC